MARTAALVSLLMLAAGLGGCLSGANEASGVGKELPAIGSLLAGPTLWNDPQNNPHPAFGFATLSSPAEGPNVPKWWQPIAASPLPNPVKGIDLLARSPDDVRKGAGLALFGSLAILPGYGSPTTIMDVSDPAHPKTLGSFMPQEGMGSHRGAVVIPYPSGRLVTVISTGSGLDVWDITDPTQPEPLPAIKVRSHKVGVIPGTPIVYNAPSSGGEATPEGSPGKTEMYDFTNPDAVVQLPDFKNGYGCHHVYFWNDVAQKKFRGLCAGSQFAQIWDTKDPRNPTVIVNVPIPQGTAGTQNVRKTSGASALPWAHYAGLSNNGKILLVGDENGGGSSPPGCVASVNTPAGSVSTPVGALWFYDVSNEKDPKLLGWYSPLNDPTIKNAPTQSCTAHHGRMIPSQKDLIAMSWYGDGVIVIDFTNLDFSKGVLPKVVDQFADKSDTWETWYNRGYLFTGDLVRGMDVLKIV